MVSQTPLQMTNTCARTFPSLLTRTDALESRAPRHARSVPPAFVHSLGENTSQNQTASPSDRSSAVFARPLFSLHPANSSGCLLSCLLNFSLKFDREWKRNARTFRDELTCCHVFFFSRHKHFTPQLLCTPDDSPGSVCQLSDWSHVLWHRRR